MNLENGMRCQTDITFSLPTGDIKYQLGDQEELDQAFGTEKGGNTSWVKVADLGQNGAYLEVKALHYSLGRGVRIGEFHIAKGDDLDFSEITANMNDDHPLADGYLGDLPTNIKVQHR